MKIPLFCRQSAKEWYFSFPKHCLEAFNFDRPLWRLTERTIKGYYNNTLNFLLYVEKQHGVTEVEEIYNANGFDIALVQRLLQHSSASTTQRYIGIEPQKIEQAIQNHANLI